MTECVIYTDGACSGNPGPGGWGAVLRWNDTEKEMHGGDPLTTNNRMELMAAIQALEALQRPAKVDLYTDSKYLLDGITKWIKGWQRNGWLTSAKKPVKNDDLWRRLSEAMSRHEVTWLWVKGHAGDPGNERADALARRGIEEAVTMVRSVNNSERSPPQPAARDPYGGAKTTTRARSSVMSVNLCVSPAGTNTTLPGPTTAVCEGVTSVARRRVDPGVREDPHGHSSAERRTCGSFLSSSNSSHATLKPRKTSRVCSTATVRCADRPPSTASTPMRT